MAPVVVVSDRFWRTVATIFLPLTAESTGRNATQPLTVMVRGTAGRDTVTAVRDRIASLFPGLTMFNVPGPDRYGDWS